MFLAKLERYRDSCLKPHNYDILSKALKLWDNFSKDPQTILRCINMDNYSMEPEMLTKMKAVTITRQSVLFNINNFLCMRQQNAESVRLYLGRLKSAARHCNFTLPMGQTCYTDKRVMYTLVQGRDDTVITEMSWRNTPGARVQA